MEVLVMVASLWLVLTGLYGGFSAYSAYRRRGRQRAGGYGASSRGLPGQPVYGGPFSEVDMLRLQVETLRSEMSALSTAPRGERARLRRYRSGLYTELPRPLRRQVREIRNFRHPISV